MAEQSTQLARHVLSVANRVQAKGTTVRLIVPRAPEVVYELGMELTDTQLQLAEGYLKNHGYITPTDLNPTWGTYTITPAGLEWLEVEELYQTRRELETVQESPRAQRNPLQPEPAESAEPEAPERAEPRPVSDGARGPAQPRSWWRRVFGG